ncbi:MAG: hypothetical protein IJ602_02305 [Paludibacteraceae bacterium]|nr:hypothetical protein [Paludibacteraceae bacterium]
METVQKRFSKTEYKQYLAGVLKGFEQMNEAFRTLATTAKEWDGKVYNKRFADAVNERVSGYAHFDMGSRQGYNNLFYECKFYLNERAVRVDTKRMGRDSYNWCYFDDELNNSIYYTYSSAYANDIFKVDEKLNERINGEAFAAACDKVIKSNERRAAMFCDALKTWDKSLAALKKIEDYARKQSANINPFFVDKEGARQFMWQNIERPAIERFGE